MWTTNEECRDSLAAFSQPSRIVATWKVPVKLLYMRRSRAMKRPPHTVVMPSEVR